MSTTTKFQRAMERAVVAMVALFIYALPSVSSIITDPAPATPGAPITSAGLNSRFTTIFNDYDGNITNANIANAAAINPSKFDFTKEYGPVLEAAATAAFASGVTGDANARWTATSDGYLKFGPGGGTALDTMLSRASAGILQLTDPALTTNQTFQAGQFSARVFGDANDKVQVSTAGIKFGPGGGTVLDNMIARGTSTALYFLNAAGTAYQNAEAAVFGVRAAFGDANFKVSMDSSGIHFGAGGASAQDVLLKRESSTGLSVRNTADNAYEDLTVNTLHYTSLTPVVVASFPDEFRLTLSSGNPVPTSDLASPQATLYLCPYNGNHMAVWNGSSWITDTSAQISIALSSLTANLPYDIFVYDNAGTLTIDTPLAWTSISARNVALAYLNGVLVKSTDNTRRYVGTFQATTTSATEDTAGDRAVFNYYNRVTRTMSCAETAASWTVGSSVRAINAGSDTTNGTGRVSFMVGVPEDAVNETFTECYSTTGSIAVQAAIGLNSTSTVTVGGTTSLANTGAESTASYNALPPLGYNFLQCLDQTNTGTPTAVKSNGASIFGNTAAITAMTGTWKD